MLMIYPFENLFVKVGVGRLRTWGYASLGCPFTASININIDETVWQSNIIMNNHVL